MKLSQNKIQFIDTYLKNSEVFYVDIRYEMIDHIATAVEEKMTVENIDFYNAFKNYMAKNKTSVLKNNKESNSFSWIEIKKYLLFLVKPSMLVFGLLLILLYKFVDINALFSSDFTFSNLLFVLIVLISLFQIFYYYVILKKRFYSLEKSGITLFIIYYLQLFINLFFKEINSIVGLIFFYLIVGYFFYFFNEIKTFKKHKYTIA